MIKIAFIKNNNDMIFSVTCYLNPKYVDIYFPQCKVYAGVQGKWLASHFWRAISIKYLSELIIDELNLHISISQPVQNKIV